MLIETRTKETIVFVVIMFIFGGILVGAGLIFLPTLVYATKKLANPWLRL